nr:ABC transporter ATP-binding protein [Rhizobium sp. CF142]
MSSPVANSVSVANLTVAYGAAKILDRLSLDVPNGEFLVLLGSSGCGKSTLLNAIAGLHDVTDGRIEIAGQDVTWSEPKDRGIGMVFQSYALYPRMSVAQNMGFGLKIKGMKTEEISARVERTAKLLQIDHLLKRKPADLSGGQRQRVAIGRALVRDVDVFLFDEPLSNLDAQLRAELRVEIKKLHQSLGNTMIYVTHDQVEAMTLADRIAVMKAGRIQQLAPPAEVYARPANLFVAGFLGTPKMNFIEGDILQLEGAQIFQAGDLRFPLPSGVGYHSGGAIFGIRPEHIHLVDQGMDFEGLVMQAQVSLVEPLGPETIVWVQLADIQLSLRTAPEMTPTAGNSIRIGFALENASFFDAQTTARI